MSGNAKAVMQNKTMALEFGNPDHIKIARFYEEGKIVQKIKKKLQPKYHWDKKVRCKHCNDPLFKIRGWDLSKNILVWDYCRNTRCPYSQRLQTSNLAGTSMRVIEHTWELEYMLERYEEMMPKIKELTK